MTTASKAPKRFTLKKTNSRWMWVMIIGLAALAIVAIWAMTRPKPDENAKITTAPVVRETITKIVAATGRVVPNFEVEIKGKASGKIVQLPYDVSDQVRQGALLVQLDPIDESRQVSQAQANLAGVYSRMDQTRLNLQVARQNLRTDIAKANAELKAAEARYRETTAQEQRLGMLVKNRYISQQEYEAGATSTAQAETALENARVRLRELQTQQVALRAQAQEIDIAAAEARAQGVQLATSQQRLEETKIYAPISGVVTSRTGQIGQIVSSGISNVGGGTTIMTLADLSRIFVLASVDESDIGLVREGQAVSITVDAHPGKTFAGRVVRISPKGLEESNVVTFEVKIEVFGENKQLLKPEMTANVEITIDRRPNVLAIPAEAVFTKEQRSFVRVVSDEKKPKPRPVVTGINNGTLVEIVSGLQPGEKVVVSRGQTNSHWRRGGGQGGPGGGNRGQMMMMRGMGGGRR